MATGSRLLAIGYYALFMVPVTWLGPMSLEPPDESFAPGWSPDPFYRENDADVLG